MVIRDESKAFGLFGLNPFDDSMVVTPVKSIRKKATKEKQPKVSNTNKARFDAKLAEEAFDEFDYKDWFQYFVMKFQHTNGRKYLAGNFAKEYAVFKSILNELHWHDLKTMIDFIFDSGQDITNVKTVGTWILSKGWINTIYQNSQLWKDGEYKTKTQQQNANKRNREWVASRKEAGAGLSYGKPVREEELPEKPTKSRIKF